MKVCIMQMPYSEDLSRAEELQKFKLEQLDLCDSSLDLIVLPEYSDVPCATSDLEETLFCHHKYIGPLLEKCVATAKRCHALVFVNALSHEETGWRNTTYFGWPTCRKANRT